MEPLHGICEGVFWGEAKCGSGRAAQERRKLGVRLREEAAFFNNIFHRCCHLYHLTSKWQLLSISKNRGRRKSLEEIPWPVSEGVFKGMRDEGLQSL